MAARHIERVDHLTSRDNDGYCVHGTYVGGCGIDWMCGHCEMGNYDVGEQDMGTVVVSGLNPDGKPFTHRFPVAPIENANNSADSWRGLLGDTVPDLTITVEPSVRRFFYNADTDPLDG